MNGAGSEKTDFMTVTFEDREVPVVLLRNKHYDQTIGGITTEGCCDVDVIDRDNVTVNGDGSLFYHDKLHSRKLYIDANGNVYLLDE